MKTVALKLHAGVEGDRSLKVKVTFSYATLLPGKLTAQQQVELFARLGQADLSAALTEAVEGVIRAVDL